MIWLEVGQEDLVENRKKCYSNRKIGEGRVRALVLLKIEFLKKY